MSADLDRNGDPLIVGPRSVPCDFAPCSATIGEPCSGPHGGFHPGRWVTAGYVQSIVDAISEEEALTEAGRHIRSVSRNGSAIVRPSRMDYVPCAREHEPGRVCMLPNGHGPADFAVATARPVGFVGHGTPPADLRAQRDLLGKMLREVTEVEWSEPCQFDHHGDCQAHGWGIDYDEAGVATERECVIPRAKRAIEAMGL